jgi:hypothetical protein
VGKRSVCVPRKPWSNEAMAIDMLLHDVRLAGNAPEIADNQWDVSASVPMKQIVGWTQVVARGSGGIRRLIIMAHGYEDAGHRGGYGIQLGSDGLTLSTVNLFSALRGLVTSIILYSCAVADTAPGTRMRAGDGNLLISRLAARSRAYVVASNATQYYSIGNQTQPLDFGSWEGDVYLYGPNGQRRLIDWGWEP